MTERYSNQLSYGANKLEVALAASVAAKAFQGNTHFSATGCNDRIRAIDRDRRHFPDTKSLMTSVRQPSLRDLVVHLSVAQSPDS